MKLVLHGEENRVACCSFWQFIKHGTLMFIMSLALALATFLVWHTAS